MGLEKIGSLLRHKYSKATWNHALLVTENASVICTLHLANRRVGSLGVTLACLSLHKLVSGSSGWVTLAQ